MPCAVVAADLVSGGEIVIDQGPLVPAIMATTALPGILSPVVRGAELLVDGGGLNNLPVDVAERMGAQRVIAVQLIDARAPFEGALNTPAPPVAQRNGRLRQFKVMERALLLMVAQATELRLMHHPPALRVCPNVSHISLLDMTQPEAGFRAGVEAARSITAELLKLRAWRKTATRLAPLPWLLARQ